MLFPWIVGVLLSIGVPVADSSHSSQDKQKEYNVVCYLASWANFRKGEGKFLIEDIDPHLCTHLVYGFAKLDNDHRIAPSRPHLDLKEHSGLGAYERFNGLKKKNPQLKTLLAIGGWLEGSSNFSPMAREASSRKNFIQSCIETLRKYDFDGLDLDWEFPALIWGHSEDKKNFAILLKELKEAFKPYGLLLTAAVSALEEFIDDAYDIPELGRHLDLINLMAYDFHGPWQTITGHNSPLYPRPNEPDYWNKLSVDYAVQKWLNAGAPAHKLILGMPFYGRSFTLRNASRKGLDVPTAGEGMAGEFTRQKGYLGYNEICRLLQKENDWMVVVGKHVQAPYIVKGMQWIGYDSIQSIKEKVKYLVKMKLGGAMVWSLDTDDFRGSCHGLKFPLLRAINAGLHGSKVHQPDINFDQVSDVVPTTSTGRTPPIHQLQETTTLLSLQSTRAQPEEEVELPCPQTGYFRHPKDCSLFYICQPGLDAEFITYLFSCGTGTVFNEKYSICDYPRNVPGCK